MERRLGPQPADRASLRASLRPSARRPAPPRAPDRAASVSAGGHRHYAGRDRDAEVDSKPQNEPAGPLPRRRL